MALVIRDAVDDDLPAMVAIYNQLVRETTVVWTCLLYTSDAADE